MLFVHKRLRTNVRLDLYRSLVNLCECVVKLFVQ